MKFRKNYFRNLKKHFWEVYNEIFGNYGKHFRNHNK